MKRSGIAVGLLIAAAMGIGNAPPAWAEDSLPDAEAQGHADRLTPQTSADKSFLTGCQEAQRRLAASDVRRKSEPEYKAGWNMPLEVTSPPRMVGLVNPPIPALLALPIIGTGLAEAKAAYPQMVCDDSMCGFDPKPSPPELCPELGACKQMTLFVRDDRVVGYTAEFPSIAFMATVGHLTRELGAPKTEVRHVAMMTDASWSWVVGNGMSLSLILYGGRNMFNAPISSQTILLEPGT